MKPTIGILAALLVATGAGAQFRTFYGPFTEDEGQMLSAVWPEIRGAANYEDIDWRALGSNRAPGSRDLQRLMSENWGEMRRAQRFEEIDWNWYADEPRTSHDGRDWPTGRLDGQFTGGFAGSAYGSPFSREDEAAMSRVWGQIRRAADFDDIDWRSVGLSGPPGSREARRLTAQHWDALRDAARFEDIDWATTTGPQRRLRR